VPGPRPQRAVRSEPAADRRDGRSVIEVAWDCLLVGVARHCARGVYRPETRHEVALAPFGPPANSHDRQERCTDGGGTWRELRGGNTFIGLATNARGDLFAAEYAGGSQGGALEVHLMSCEP